MLAIANRTTARGFEPLRAEPNGFLVHHLNHSVTLSLASLYELLLFRRVYAILAPALQTTEVPIKDRCATGAAGKKHTIPKATKATYPQHWRLVVLARGPQFNAQSSPLAMCRLATLGQDRQNEGREIRTPNLLIWSQTRYRCGIPPHGNVAVSACHWNCTSCADSLAGRKGACGILATRTQAQAAHVRIEHPDRLRYCGSPVQPTAHRSRKANGNCGVPPRFCKRAAPGIEPGTSRSRSENHATRPSSR